jgi:Protein of unknown function (DUF1190)
MGMIARQELTIPRPGSAAHSEEDVLRGINWRIPGGTGRRALIIALAATLMGALASGDAQARSRKPASRAQSAAAASYADERECVAKAALDASECRNAAMNSHAEYEEKAPRLESSGACTRLFGARNCSMRIGASRGIAFLPSYRGFRLLPGKAGEMMAVPMLAGGDAGIAFTPRPVTRLDIAQDAARGMRAQAAWQAAHSPVMRSARGGGGAPYREAPQGAAPDLTDQGGEPTGPAATYPVSPSMLKAMQEEMRKYGTPPAPGK